MSCIFCKIAGREVKASIVFESEDMIAFDDMSPQAPVHVLIIPKKHVDKVEDLKDYPSKAMKAAVEIAKIKGVEESGYRIVMNKGGNAGQAVAHIHFHLLGGRQMKWPPG